LKRLAITKPEFDQLLYDAVDGAKAKQTELCADFLAWGQVDRKIVTPDHP
jgi:hypothetical protein